MPASSTQDLKLLSGLTHQDLVVVKTIDCTLANFSQGATEGQTADLSFSCGGSLPACEMLRVEYGCRRAFLHRFGWVGHSQRIPGCLGWLCVQSGDHIRLKLNYLKERARKGKEGLKILEMYFLWDYWLHSACICLAAVAGAVGAVGETRFPASLANLQSSRERVKVCGVLTATLHA